MKIERLHAFIFYSLVTFFAVVGALEMYNKVKLGMASRPFVQKVMYDEDWDNVTLDQLKPEPQKTKPVKH